MKRAASDESGGEAKKAAGGGGGVGLKGMPASENKTDPIPRPIRENEITLHFNQVTWEEIGPSELKYLPLCQTPYYMMDPATLKLLNKFKGLWSTAKYHTPKARISNIIMLQDDLINQGGTPMETTAFTQACYMLEYQPIGQTQFFHLSTMNKCSSGDVKSLSYDLAMVECDARDVSQLIKLESYEDFEKLCIHTSKVNIYGGFDPYEKLRRDMTDNITTLDNVYIPPNDIDIGPLAAYAGNLQPGKLTSQIVKAFDQITFARNMGKFKLHAYNDTFEIPITTNIEGKNLLAIRENDFTNRMLDFERGGIKYHYYTEFCWPSKNRPYYTRSSNLTQYSPLLDPKSNELQPLKHYFFTMPPIRKANGALLKQRASFMLEQSFSVTYKFPESVWDDEDVKGESTSKFILDQRDGIIIRPNVYGTLKKQYKNEGIICPADTEMVCTNQTGRCPTDNDIESLADMLVDAGLNSKVWSWSWAPEGIEIDAKNDVVCTLSEDPEGMWFRMSNLRSPEFITAWKAWQAKSRDKTIPSSTLYVKSKSYHQWRGLVLSGRTTEITVNNPFEWGSGQGRYFYFLMGDYVKVLEWAGIQCQSTRPISKAEDNDLKPVDRQATVFFC